MACSKVARSSGLPTTTSQPGGSLRSEPARTSARTTQPCALQHRDQAAADVAGAAGDEDAGGRRRSRRPRLLERRPRRFDQDAVAQQLVERRGQLAAALRREQQRAGALDRRRTPRRRRRRRRSRATPWPRPGCFSRIDATSAGSDAVGVLAVGDDEQVAPLQAAASRASRASTIASPIGVPPPRLHASMRVAGGRADSACARRDDLACRRLRRRGR